MNFVEMRRKNTKWSIEQNPADITITRTEKKDMGGYFEDIEATLTPQTVRVFSEKSSSQQVVSGLIGEKQVDRHFGILADYEADIKAGTHVKDEFEADGMFFVIKSVYPQSINGEVVGYQGELERVN